MGSLEILRLGKKRVCVSVLLVRSFTCLRVSTVVLHEQGSVPHAMVAFSAAAFVLNSVFVLDLIGVFCLGGSIALFWVELFLW